MSMDQVSSDSDKGKAKTIDSIESMSQEDEEKGVIDQDGEYSVGSYGGGHRGLSTKQKAAQDERATLAKQESQAISYLRWIVFLVLMVVGATFAFLVFFFTNRDQVDRFEDEFRYYALQVAESFNSQLERIIDASDTLSTDITSHALITQSEFPFVTLPDFELKAANARIAGDTVMIYYLPHVPEELTGAWETYAEANRQQGTAAFESEEKLKVHQDASFGLEPQELYGLAEEFRETFAVAVSTRVNTSKIWYVTGEFSEDKGTNFFPFWQVSPQIPIDIINMDMGQYPHLKGAVDISVKTGEAVLGTLFDLAPKEGSVGGTALFEMVLQSGQYRHEGGGYLWDPMSSLIYPVFDGFGEDRKAKGVLFTTIYWRFMMRKIFPSHIKGIFCVIENSNEKMQTYIIDGPEARYVGPGDFHDPAFDYLKQTYDIVSESEEAAGPDTRSFTTAKVNGQFMNYTLTVYPSTTFKSIYVNRRAESGAYTIACTFAVAIFLFLVYDLIVQRRQKIVLERAVRATAVVSSLYPANVREQIINDEDTHPSKKNKGPGAFLRSAVEESASNASPLASKYPDCTVYFADLVGFTKWSSTRQPEMVFQLLEAIFKEFDVAAAKRGVFKVETIGDCYMAVTGLPNAQPDHAVIMAKFAHDCMIKLDQIVERLATTLGEGTDDLSLRTGMHSGEVTAGVLRGEKGRFQLFGDTVNTASRMESTGSPRKIQVSQSTADALILGGKEQWLVPRKEKVFAKGKGEVQTYFLQMKERTEQTMSVSHRSAD